MLGDVVMVYQKLIEEQRGSLMQRSILVIPVLEQTAQRSAAKPEAAHDCNDVVIVEKFLFVVHEQ